jgi:hypothetical protein
MQPSPVSNQSLLSESVASSQVDSTSVDKAVPETEDLQGPRAEGLVPPECDPPSSVSDTAQQPSEEQNKSLEKPKQKRIVVSCAGRKWDLPGLNADVEMVTVVYTVTQMYTIALTIIKLMLLRKSEKKIQ